MMNAMEKTFTIIWTDGWKYRIHIHNEDAIKELNANGLWFDDFCDDGTGDEIWKPY